MKNTQITNCSIFTSYWKKKHAEINVLRKKSENCLSHLKKINRSRSNEKKNLDIFDDIITSLQNCKKSEPHLWYVFIQWAISCEGFINNLFWNQWWTEWTYYWLRTATTKSELQFLSWSSKNVYTIDLKKTYSFDHYPR